MWDDVANDIIGKKIRSAEICQCFAKINSVSELAISNWAKVDKNNNTRSSLLYAIIRATRLTQVRSQLVGLARFSC